MHGSNQDKFCASLSLGMNDACDVCIDDDDDDDDILFSDLD